MASVGLPASQFDMFEPWFPAITLSVLPLTKLGYDPEQGAEKLLTGFAKTAGKPVAGLETLPEQLGFFDTLPETQQVTFLNAVVNDLDKLGRSEEHTSELQSLMSSSYAVFCLKKNK